MEYSGAGGKLIHEKNQKQKSRDTVPLIGLFKKRYVACLILLMVFKWYIHLIYRELPDYFALLKSGNIMYRYTINVPSSWHSCRPYMYVAIVISLVNGYFVTIKTIISYPTKASNGKLCIGLPSLL
jgi:hypothetical protein